MRVLVTGAAGFIGSNIVEKFKDEFDVIGIDNLITGRMSNIADFRKDFKFIQGDLTNYAVCEEVIKGIDVVCHQAALPSVPRSLENPRATNAHGVYATINLLTAAKNNDVKRVVFASSSSVYGNTKELPKKETMDRQPLSPYAASKAACEMYMKGFANSFDIDTVSLRYFNVIGPRQNPDSGYAAVVPKFCNRVLHGMAPIIYGDGETSRDFTYVDNVVQANRLAALNGGELNGEVYNIACGGRYSLNQLAKLIMKYGNKTDLDILYEDERAGDVKHSQACINKAQRDLGYRPEVDFNEGVAKTFEYYKGCLHGQL